MPYKAIPIKNDISIGKCVEIFDTIEKSGGVNVAFNILEPIEFTFDCPSFLPFYREFSKSHINGDVMIRRP